MLRSYRTTYVCVATRINTYFTRYGALARFKRGDVLAPTDVRSDVTQPSRQPHLS